MSDTKRLYEEPDYVALERFENSLSRLEQHYRDGVPPRIAAAALGLTERQFHGRYGAIIAKLQLILKE